MQPGSVIQRNNVTITGEGATTIVFAHGFGCDQHMWRFSAPAFEANYRVVLFDHVGAGRSDLSQYNSSKYSTLHGYADDLAEIIAEVSTEPLIYVGHSVSAMIGVLAALKDPRQFRDLIMIGPSPCYTNHNGYAGGFSRADIEGLLDMLEKNHLGWSSAMAPQIMSNPDRPELSAELTESFCRTNPEIARQFARVTFLSDNRADLPHVKTPSLILQCSDDIIAPDNVGQYVHAQIAGSRFVKLRATGHCPHLSAPEETVKAIKQYLERT